MASNDTLLGVEDTRAEVWLRERRRVAYLSGAPRVSTRQDAESGGPRSHVRGVIAAFRSLGYEVEPFIVGDQVPPEITRKSGRAISATVLHALAADVGRLSFRVINRRRAWRRLAGRIDWVYERFSACQALGRVFQRCGLPWVLETQGPFYQEAKAERKSMVLTGIARKLELEAYRQCDALVCVSHTLRDIVCREADISPSKVIVVPNGVDTEVFDPQKHPARRLFSGFTIGFAGGLLAWQGLDLLLHALAELRAEKGIQINLVVVGDGLMKNEWQNLAQELGISETVSFTGRVNGDEVPSYIAGFDFGYSGQVRLQSGSMYHSPLKIYEYMAMAKPMVASAFDDAKRMIREGEIGFLYAPGDKEELKRALMAAHEARHRAGAMGRVARSEIVANHSWTARVKFMTGELAGMHHFRKI
jgi:glycosyltransferase involved in cell wall biosynthesis